MLPLVHVATSPADWKGPEGRNQVAVYFRRPDTADRLRCSVSARSNWDLTLAALDPEEPQGTGTAGGVGTSHSLGPAVNPDSAISPSVNPVHALVSLFGDWHHSHDLAKQTCDSPSWHPPSLPASHCQSCQFCISHILFEQAPGAATGTSAAASEPAAASSCNPSARRQPNLGLSLLGLNPPGPPPPGPSK